MKMATEINDQPKQFAKKYLSKLKEFAPEYMDGVEAASTDEIKRMILVAEQNSFEIEHAIESNGVLTDLKEKLKTEMAPFKEGMQTETAKIKYCMFKLDERQVKI